MDKLKGTPAVDLSNLCNLSISAHGLFEGNVYQKTWEPISNCKRFPGDRQQVRRHVGAHGGNYNSQVMVYRSFATRASASYKALSQDERNHWNAWAKRYDLAGWNLFLARYFWQHSASMGIEYRGRFKQLFDYFGPTLPPLPE